MRNILAALGTVAAGVAMIITGAALASAADDRHPCNRGVSECSSSTTVDDATTTTIVDEPTTTVPEVTEPLFPPDDQAPPATPVEAVPMFTG